MEATIIKIYSKNGFAATVEIDEANGAVHSAGNATSTVTNELNDTGATFVADGVDVGDEVFNSDDTLYAYVTVVDSEIKLTLSADIFNATEAYTVSGEKTHNITDTDMGTTDAADLDPVANPVIAGSNTFQKYQTIHITAMGGSSAIDNLQIWRTSALGGAATHVTNARTAAYARKAYVAPTESATAQADQTMPTSDPAASNLGIDGSLSGSRTAAGHSDFLVHQIQTNGADVAGSTSTMNYQYDETA